MRKNNSISLI